MIVQPENAEQLARTLKMRPLVLYGMGDAGIRIARWCDEKKINYVFADKNAVVKQKETDKRVLTPEHLKEECFDANIVITSIIYHDEIAKQLLELGFDSEQFLSFRLFMPGNITWKDLEHTTIWGENSERVRVIADWIPADTRIVADYGAGKLTLKKHLNPNTEYCPIDYIARSDYTVLCDFNDGVFPKIIADVSVCTATLVFIATVKELLYHICEHTRNIIILSYVTVEVFSNADGRRASGYVNDLSDTQIIYALRAGGFRLKEKRPDPANSIDTLYLFAKCSGEKNDCEPC